MSLSNKICSLVRFLLAAAYLSSKCGRQLNPFILSLKNSGQKGMRLSGEMKGHKYVAQTCHMKPCGVLFSKKVYFACLPYILLRASERFFQRQFSLSTALLDKQILFPLLKRLRKKGKKVTPQGDIATLLQSQE